MSASHPDQAELPVKSAQGRDFSDFQPVQAEAGFDGDDFGIAKATEGTGWTGATFAPNVAVMRKVAAKRPFFPGAYHFLHPGEDPVAQARHCVSAVKAAGLRPGDILAVDSEIMSGAVARLAGIEVGKPTRRSHLAVSEADLAVTPAQADACTLAFCDEAAALAGPRNPVICYTMHAVGQYLVRTAAKYPLWFAWPRVTAPPADMIAPWRSWLFWQWSWAGGNAGDRDAFNGTAADLAAWVASFAPHQREPVMHVADGTMSLNQMVTASPGMTVHGAWWETARHRPHGWGKLEREYLQAGNWDAPMKAGTEIWG